MAKLSQKETVAGVLDGSIAKVSRTEALALLKALGFKDVSHSKRQDIFGGYSGVITMKHKDLASYVPVTRDAFLKEAQMLEFKTALAQVMVQTNG